METINIKRSVGRPLGSKSTSRKTDDPEYYKNYYHQKLGVDVICDKCNCTASKQKLKRHQQSKKCITASLNLALN
jgi:hypothetical protein